jgi:hypothetical protein
MEDDEIELEVFRADTRASRGITAAHIAASATAYDPANAPAGICLGHPKDDTPAFGRVKAFRAEGSSLFARIPVKPDLVEGVKADQLLNRSLAFFSPNHEANPRPGTYYPRHLGFLGASAPGIPGMAPLTKALAFSADDKLEAIGDPAEAIVFEATPTPVISFRAEQESTVTDKKEPTAAELAERESRLREQETQFAARQREAASTANAGIVDALVAGGKLLPKDRDRTLFVFNALAGTDHEGKALEFATARKFRRRPRSPSFSGRASSSSRSAAASRRPTSSPPRTRTIPARSPPPPAS